VICDLICESRITKHEARMIHVGHHAAGACGPFAPSSQAAPVCRGDDFAAQRRRFSRTTGCTTSSSRCRRARRRAADYLTHARLEMVWRRRRQDSYRTRSARGRAGRRRGRPRRARRLSAAAPSAHRDAAAEFGAAIARSSPTRQRADPIDLVGTLPRHEIYLAQTPQAVRTSVLRDALALAAVPTHDEACSRQPVTGASRTATAQSEDHHADDLAMAESLLDGDDFPCASAMAI